MARSPNFKDAVCLILIGLLGPIHEKDLQFLHVLISTSPLGLEGAPAARLPGCLTAAAAMQIPHMMSGSE